jgi:hypothetical protein
MNPNDPHDLQRIEAEARRLRAEAMRATVASFAAWVRRIATRQPASAARNA